MGCIKQIVVIYVLIHVVNTKIISLPEITVDEQRCTIPPVKDSKCLCPTSGSNPNKWIIWPDWHQVYYLQAGLVISEPSPAGFVIASDIMECSAGMVSCSIEVTSERSFSSTASWNVVADMSLKLWNTFTASISSFYGRSYTKTSTASTSYTCTFPGNSSGYLAILAQTGLVVGWEAICQPHWPEYCGTDYVVGQDFCRLIARVVEINEDDGSVVGRRRCVIANNEEEAQQQLERWRKLNWKGPEVDKFAPFAQKTNGVEIFVV